MKAHGCLGNIAYFAVLCAFFLLSSYFWFNFFIRGKSIETPTLVGRSITDARNTSSDLGLVLVVDNSKDRNAEKVAVGAVVWQNRAPGSLIKRGTRIYVGQSLGPLVLSVPDLSGQRARTALLRFGQRNLKLGNIAYVDQPNANGIIAEDPPVGTVVKAETPVSLLIGFPSPPPAFVMPDVIDRRFDEVRYALENRRLTVSSVRFEAYPGIADGVIIRQFPLPGGPVAPGDAISFVVSRADSGFDSTRPPQPPVPNQPTQPPAGQP
jgi:beta-lactam-binding protein with PASTA domain